MFFLPTIFYLMLQVIQIFLVGKITMVIYCQLIFNYCCLKASF